MTDSPAPTEPRRRRRRPRRRPGANPAAAQAQNGRQGGSQPNAKPHPNARPSTPAEIRSFEGLLELGRDGGGHLRHLALSRPDDPHLSAKLISSLGLRAGDLLEVEAQGRAVRQVRTVNGRAAEGRPQRPDFDRLTALHPDTVLKLGTSREALTGRLLDLIAPVGRGQRGLIVAPPKAGKTTILRDIAIGAGSDPDITLITCLVGERPEEVTELRRSIPGMILAADLDMPVADHIRVASLGVEQAKRLVEEGRHVVVLIDSLTRLARAYNLSITGGGRTLSGGMEVSALQPVRKIFGAARATEEAGSLTIIATCLVDTGSRMDDVVYEEFKGTGNMEVYLDRRLAELRLFPAVDIARSGTRREELLLDPRTLQQVHALRRRLAGMPPDEALSALLGALKRQLAVEEVG